MSAPSTRVRELRGIVLLAAPLVGGQITTMGMNFVDTVMAGRLSAEVLAAVAVGAAGWASVSFFALGTLMVSQATVARLDGAGQLDRVGPHIRQVLWVSQLLAAGLMLIVANLRPVLEAISVEPAIIPTAEGYLRGLVWGVPAWSGFLVLRFLSEGLGYSRPVLYFGVVGLAVNVFMNWVLMYGRLGAPQLGAIGCGWATAIVWWVQFLGMVLFVRWKSRFRHVRPFARFDPPRPAEILAFLRTGTPSGVAFFLEVSLFASVALFIGSLGTVAVAAHQLAVSFASLSFMVPLGISMAISVRVGRARGRGDWAGVRHTVKVGVAIVAVANCITAGVMLIFPRTVAAIYTNDPVVVGLAVQLLFLAAIFQLSDGLQVSMVGALRGLEDTRAVMVITVIAYWVLGFPLGMTLGFPLGYGPHGMWAGLIIGLTVAALLLVVRFRRTVATLTAAGQSGAPPPP